VYQLRPSDVHNRTIGLTLLEINYFHCAVEVS